MKTKALYLTSILISSTLFLLSVSGSLFASKCGQELKCPPGIKYPYKFCNIETGKEEIICTDDPLELERNDTNLVARKIKLPVFVIGASGLNTYLMQHFNAYKTGSAEGGIILFGNAHVGTISMVSRELQAASNKWNCVCGDTVDVTDSASINNIGTLISTVFSSNPDDFNTSNPIGAYVVAAVAVAMPRTDYDEETDRFTCGIDVGKSKIIFNATPHFLFDRTVFPALGTPLKKGWVGQEYIGNAFNPAIPPFPNVTLLSFMSVAMHELSHMLGFWHYDTNKLTGIEQYCDNDEALYGVMKYDTDDIRRENLIELSLHDKCMMAKLYCPDLVVLNIFEYQPQTQKVYPNPGKYVVSFDFELPRYTEDLRMTVKDVLGQTLLIPIENAVYEAGKHTVLINVDSLAIGTYYIIIEAGAYRTAQPVMIVR